MASLEREDIERALTKKGFEPAPGDHNFFKLMVNGRYTGIQTKTSRGTGHRTIGPVLVTQMAKQIKLTTPEFRQFVQCSLSGSDYLDLLAKREEI